MLSGTSFDNARAPLLAARAQAPDVETYVLLEKALHYLSCAEDRWLWTQRAPTNAEMDRMWEAERYKNSLNALGG